MISTHGITMTSAHYARMSAAECRQIHLATLEVLELVGVDVHADRARETLSEAGARVDGIRVRIPDYLVEDALRQAPRRMTLYDRNGRIALRAHDYHTGGGGGMRALAARCSRVPNKGRVPPIGGIIMAIIGCPLQSLNPRGFR